MDSEQDKKDVIGYANADSTPINFYGEPMHLVSVTMTNAAKRETDRMKRGIRCEIEKELADDCPMCGTPLDRWAVIGKTRVNGRWFTLIPKIHKTETDARNAVKQYNRYVSYLGSESITVAIPAHLWWAAWPSIWLRILIIKIREWFKTKGNK